MFMPGVGGRSGLGQTCQLFQTDCTLSQSPRLRLALKQAAADRRAVLPPLSAVRVLDLQAFWKNVDALAKVTIGLADRILIHRDCIEVPGLYSAPPAAMFGHGCRRSDQFSTLGRVPWRRVATPGS